MSNSVFPLQLRSFAIMSMRPVVGSMLISTLMRSPAAGATTAGVVHVVRLATSADVSRICALPSTMSVYATYRWWLVGSNAGTGYDPGPRNCPPPEMLKQDGGYRHTGLL